MKVISIVVGWIFLFGANSGAGETAKDKNLQTELSFEDLLVQGKYHFSDEAVTTVEEDKVLDGLLGIRKDFRDRIEKESVRN